MPTLKDVELAYLAGFIDADGWIGITVRKRVWANREGTFTRVGFSIGQARREILEDLSSMIGGARVGQYAVTRGARGDARVFYELRLHAPTLRWLLPALIPFLRVKRRQAEIALEFIVDSRYQGKKLTPEQVARREALRAEIQALNRKPLTELKLATAAAAEVA